MRSNKYWGSEMQKINDCEKKWIYEDLETKKQVKVLLFESKFYFDLMSFPNLLIGTTSFNDTIAFLDKEFSGKIKIGNIVTLTPKQWTDDEKQWIKPCSSVSKKSKENALKCRIKVVYYGKIDTTSIGR